MYVIVYYDISHTSHLATLSTCEVRLLANAHIAKHYSKIKKRILVIRKWENLNDLS